MNTYDVKSYHDRCLEITDQSGGYLFYRIPYSVLKTKKYATRPNNKFIVYLLFGKDPQGRDCLYVGTSKNGIDNRPTQHEDKDVQWEMCYIFTSFNQDILNNSRILYLEHELRKCIDNSERYVSKTFSTISDTTNSVDTEYCKRALPTILEAFDIMGIDIIPKRKNSIFDYVDQNTVEENKHPARELSSLNLSSDMVDYLKRIESVMMRITPKIERRIANNYVSFQYAGSNKTVVYCYPKKMKNSICCIFYGVPEQFSCTDLELRPDT